MPISYVGQATGITSATLPTHQANDLIIGFAYRDGSTTAPTIPSGWTSIASGTGGGGSGNSSSLAYIVASGAGTASGTWTNATGVVFQVYRGALVSSPIGSNASNGGSTASVTYPALTLTVNNGSSWVAGFAGHRSVNTTLETAPTGMTNRATYVDAVNELAGHDTNGGVTSWSSQSVAVGGTASNWVTRVVEIEAQSTTLTGDASLAGAGTIAVSGSKILSASSSLAGTGTLSASAIKTNLVEAFLSSLGSITATGDIGQYEGYYRRITEDGNFRVTEDVFNRIVEDFAGLLGDASLQGTGTLSATGNYLFFSGSALAGSGSTAISALKQLNALSSLTGTGVLSTQADKILNGACLFTGSGFVSASALFIVFSESHLAASGTLSASALRTAYASSSLNGIAYLVVDAEQFRVGKIYAKESGTWKEIVPIVKHNGTWKIPEVVFIKYAGEWKRIYLNGN